jgi:hypothetical protein
MERKVTDLDLLEKSCEDARKIALKERVPAYIYKQGNVYIVTTTSPAIIAPLDPKGMVLIGECRPRT